MLCSKSNFVTAISIYGVLASFPPSKVVCNVVKIKGHWLGLWQARSCARLSTTSSVRLHFANVSLNIVRLAAPSSMLAIKLKNYWGRRSWAAVIKALCTSNFDKHFNVNRNERALFWTLEMNLSGPLLCFNAIWYTRGHVCSCQCMHQQRLHFQVSEMCCGHAE